MSRLPRCRATGVPLLALLPVLAAVGALVPATGAAAATGSAAAPATFRVGAAVESIAPPCGPDGTPGANNCTPAPGGFTDPADCPATAGNQLPAGTDLPDSAFTGPRLFAFEEPYVDQQGEGHYDSGDPFVDCNGDGRWDGNFIGGGGDAPRFYDHVADPPQARAMVVANGSRTIGVGVLDDEGAFNVHYDAIRSDLTSLLPSGASLAPADVFLSSTHDESAPDSIGLYGVTSATSSANLYWNAWMEQQAAKAIAAAYAALRPATITYAEAVEPATFRQCWSSYPFVDDSHVPVLRAVDAGTGATIATVANVSQHAETLGFNNGSALDPGAPTPTTLSQENTWLSADWPYWLRQRIEAGSGGVAIEMAGSVGSVETPQVFPSAVSRTPQQFTDGGHPAGCRTEFTADRSTMTPLGYYSEDKALGDQLGAAVESALAAGTPSRSDEIDAARTDICIQTTNALFVAGGLAGVFAARPSYADPGCTVPAPVPPTGNAAATYIRSEVAAYRIGDATFATMPGEVFPFTFLRGSLGPQDMPCPDPDSSGDCGGPPNPALTCAQGGNAYAPPPWLLPHMHTPYRFLAGLGEDMVGYIFPCGNGVGVPGEYPVSNPSGDDTDRFGCGHSDDSESASSDTADVVGAALVGLLDRLGGAAQAPEDVQQGRYVLPGGVLSRDPEGTTDSVGCSVSTSFVAAGKAVAVELADGTVVRPARWMSLMGRPQPGGPDRDTRGWIDAAGNRHWLDVYPDLTLTPPADLPEMPTPALLGVAAALAVGSIGALRRRRGRSS